MAGAFVAIADSDGFLPDSERAAPKAALADGTTLGVRITRAAQSGKGPRLTARLTPEEQALIGAGAPALLQRGPNAVERLAALYPAAPVIAGTAAALATLRPALGDRVSLGPRFRRQHRNRHRRPG